MTLLWLASRPRRRAYGGSREFRLLFCHIVFLLFRSSLIEKVCGWLQEVILHMFLFANSPGNFLENVRFSDKSPFRPSQWWLRRQTDLIADRLSRDHLLDGAQFLYGTTHSIRMDFKKFWIWRHEASKNTSYNKSQSYESMWEMFIFNVLRTILSSEGVLSQIHRELMTLKSISLSTNSTRFKKDMNYHVVNTKTWERQKRQRIVSMCKIES